MGRTISFNFQKENNKKFTDEEIEQFFVVREKFTSGKLEKVWSCECFYPNPIDFYANWEGKKQFDIKNILRYELNNGDGYDFINYIDKKVEELMQGKTIKIGRLPEYSPKKKLSRLEAYKFFEKEEWITISSKDTLQKEVGGFVKVQGNEFNATLVYLALKELTMRIPSAVVTIKDEGEFLLCPIKMKQGKALPLLSQMVEDIQRYCFQMVLSPNFKGNVLNKLDLKEKDFCHEFKMDLGLGNSYGDMTRYINEKLRNIKEVEKRIIDLVPVDKYNGRSDLYFSNLESLDFKKWFDADLFTRIKEVNPKDFLTYKMTPATLLDSGEAYYGLSSEDAELESYKRIAQMQKLFGKLGVMEVAGEEKQ